MKKKKCETERIVMERENIMEKKELSCADCAVVACAGGGDKYPEFCPTARMDEEGKRALLDCYGEEENYKVTVAAAEIEHEYYGKMTRIEETVEFAKRIGAKKIGIANCAALYTEAKIVTRIFREHGFEVITACCKTGAVEKTEAGIPKECERTGKTMCNPIMQAKILNEAGTDLNIIIGLCVGHDSLFYKYSEALITTLVVKDRVLAHNPAAALYTVNTCYRKLLK